MSSCTVAIDWKTMHTVSGTQTVPSKIAPGPQLVPAMVQVWVVPVGAQSVTVCTKFTGTENVHGAGGGGGGGGITDDGAGGEGGVIVYVTVSDTANVTFA